MVKGGAWVVVTSSQEQHSTGEAVGFLVTGAFVGLFDGVDEGTPVGERDGYEIDKERKKEMCQYYINNNLKYLIHT